MKNEPALQNFADLLFNKEIFVKKEQWVIDEIDRLTKHAMKQDKWLRKNDPRTYDQAFKDSENKVLEAAVSLIDGFVLNPFDPKADKWRGPKAFAYDNVYYGHGAGNLKTFEIKRHKIWDSEWMYPERAMNTLLEHIDEVDYIATGSYKCVDDGYLCKFLMVMQGPTFTKYLHTTKNSKFPNKSYDHVKAGPENCIYVKGMM